MRPLRFQMTLFALSVLTLLVSAALEWEGLATASFMGACVLAVALVVTTFTVQSTHGAPGRGGAPRSEPPKDRPRLNHLDRFLLHSVWVFALLALSLGQALASGDLGNGVIVVFLLPVLLIGALCAALGVLVVPTKLLWRRAAESRALRRAAQR